MGTTLNNDILEKDENGNYEFIEETLNYWLKGHQYFQSPFPDYMKEELKLVSVEKFNSWMKSADAKHLKVMNKDMLVKKLEEFMFTTAFSLVKNEDEKITICYPFMPGLGSILKEEMEIEPGMDNSVTDSKVFKREIIREDNKMFLKIHLVNTVTQNQWCKLFELPE
jgi:hypothetical protein